MSSSRRVNWSSTVGSEGPESRLFLALICARTRLLLPAFDLDTVEFSLQRREKRREARHSGVTNATGFETRGIKSSVSTIKSVSIVDMHDFSQLCLKSHLVRTSQAMALDFTSKEL